MMAAATIPTHLAVREDKDAATGYSVGVPYGSLRYANAIPRRFRLSGCPDF